MIMNIFVLIIASVIGWVLGGVINKFIYKDDRCEGCGKIVYFEKSPEYDVCDICDAHICIDCGKPNSRGVASICKKHKREEE